MRIDTKSSLKSTCAENTNELVFAHFNINSIRNKFELFVDQIKGNVDVLIISETKSYDCFPVGNFLIDGFSLRYSFDCESTGGGILSDAREDILSNLLTVGMKPINVFFNST